MDRRPHFLCSDLGALCILAVPFLQSLEGWSVNTALLIPAFRLPSAHLRKCFKPDAAPSKIDLHFWTRDKHVTKHSFRHQPLWQGERDATIWLETACERRRSFLLLAWMLFNFISVALRFCWRLWRQNKANRKEPSVFVRQGNACNPQS